MTSRGRRTQKPIAVPAGTLDAISCSERIALDGPSDSNPLSGHLSDFLVRRLGVSAASVGVADPATDRFVLLQDPDLQPHESAATPFPFLRTQLPRRSPDASPTHDDVAAVVGALFLATRSNRSLAKSVPEFYAHLLQQGHHPEVDAILIRASRDVDADGDDGRDHFLYCPAEEVALFLHQWRWILSSSPGSDPIRRRDTLFVGEYLRDVLPGEDKTRDRALRGWGELVDRAQRSEHGVPGVPVDRWEALGFHDPRFLRRVIEYAKKLRGMRPPATRDTVAAPTHRAAPSEVDRYLADTIRDTLSSAGVRAPDADALQSFARFPLLPMFALTLARRAPQAHIIVPIWTSRHLAGFSHTWDAAHRGPSVLAGTGRDASRASAPDGAGISPRQPAGAAFVLASLDRTSARLSIPSLALAIRLIFRPLCAALIESRFYDGAIVVRAATSRASESMFVLSHETRQLLSLIDGGSSAETLEWVREHFELWTTLSLALGGSPDAPVDERYVPSELLSTLRRPGSLLGLCEDISRMASRSQALSALKRALDPNSPRLKAAQDDGSRAAEANLQAIDKTRIDPSLRVVAAGEGAGPLRPRLAFFLAGVAAVANALKHTGGTDKVHLSTVGRVALQIRNCRAATSREDTHRAGGTRAVLQSCFRSIGDSQVRSAFGPDPDDESWWSTLIPFPVGFIE